MEGVAQLVRDPELYTFSVFGDPTNHGPWGWRAEGHHVSLHFTVVNRELITAKPIFLWIQSMQKFGMEPTGD